MVLRRIVFLVAALAALAASVTIGAQARLAGPLAPFGVSEAAVQSMLLRVLDGGGVLIPGSQIVGTIQSGYARVPDAMRGQATTAAFAWAKSYLHSPAFATAYAKFREQHRPEGAVIEGGSIDEIVQRRIDEYVATLEAGKKGLDALRVPGLNDVVAVAGGSQHSLALLKDGTIRAWGTNKSGQLGDGTTITRKTPVPVVGVRNAVAIAADSGISAALIADGTVMTWGDGNGALGRKTFTRDAPHPTPALVDGVTGIRALAIGSIHMVALTNAGTVMSWGDNMIGEIGHPGASPRAIAGLTNVTSVEAYTGRTFAVLASGTTMALGQVPYWARIDGSDPTTAGWPIPLVIKNLNNPL